MMAVYFSFFLHIENRRFLMTYEFIYDPGISYDPWIFFMIHRFLGLTVISEVTDLVSEVMNIA